MAPTLPNGMSEHDRAKTLSNALNMVQVTTPTASNSTSTEQSGPKWVSSPIKQRPVLRSFFDLPREIRDQIYRLAVKDAPIKYECETHKSCGTLHSAGDYGTLDVESFRPLKIKGIGPWLPTVSMVSKRFGREIRGQFFQYWRFSIFEDTTQYHLMGPQSLPMFKGFLSVLSLEERRNLRSISIYDKVDVSPFAIQVEKALEPCKHALHHNVSIKVSGCWRRDDSDPRWKYGGPDYRTGHWSFQCRFERGDLVAEKRRGQFEELEGSLPFTSWV